MAVLGRLACISASTLYTVSCADLRAIRRFVLCHEQRPQSGQDSTVPRSQNDIIEGPSSACNLKSDDVNRCQLIKQQTIFGVGRERRKKTCSVLRRVQLVHVNRRDLVEAN